MSKEVAVLATVAAGGLVAAQAPANNVLSDRLGTWGAVSVNFVVGTICVLTITFATRAPGRRPGTTGSWAALAERR